MTNPEILRHAITWNRLQLEHADKERGSSNCERATAGMRNARRFANNIEVLQDQLENCHG